LISIAFISEQKEKLEAKERYWKLHQQGLTVEAKQDLQRLAQIRADREASQAKRKAELESMDLLLSFSDQSKLIFF
jgi:hypothetical protein